MTARSSRYVTGVRAWLFHLGRSPFCHNSYAGVCDTHGRLACPCGWVETIEAGPDELTWAQLIGDEP